uniref:Transmembrane protein n=1 Tax=Pithovirus LCPAC406 TaxID=2506599 RepID=A0A481ZEX5_9VIRU|nr:MAG: hypothetical protein LCPAC406_00660 [Pithovirus LCPAC406]
MTLGLILIPTCGNIATSFVYAKLFTNGIILFIYEIIESLSPLVLIIDSINPTCLLLFVAWSGHKCNDDIMMLALAINIIEEFTVIMIMVDIASTLSQI